MSVMREDIVDDNEEENVNDEPQLSAWPPPLDAFDDDLSNGSSNDSSESPTATQENILFALRKILKGVRTENVMLNAENNMLKIENTKLETKLEYRDNEIKKLSDKVILLQKQNKKLVTKYAVRQSVFNDDWCTQIDKRLIEVEKDKSAAILQNVVSSYLTSKRRKNIDEWVAPYLDVEVNVEMAPGC